MSQMRSKGLATLSKPAPTPAGNAKVTELVDLRKPVVNKCASLHCCCCCGICKTQPAPSDR